MHDGSKVPAHFTAVGLHRHQRGGVFVITGAPVAAILVIGGVAGRQVDQPQLFISGNRAPYIGCAAWIDFALGWLLVWCGPHRIPGPLPLAGDGVVGAHGPGRRVAALVVGDLVTYHHHAVDHGWTRGV